MKRPQSDVTRSPLRFLLGEVRACALVLLSAVLLSFLIATGKVLLPYLIGRGIDLLSAWKPGDRRLLLAQLRDIFLLSLVCAVGMGLLSYASNRLSFALAKNLRAKLFDKFQRLTISVHDRRSRGELLSLITGDVDNISDSALLSLETFFSGLAGLFISLAFMLFLSLKMALLVLALSPLSLLISRFIARKSRHFFLRQSEWREKLNTLTEENVNELVTLKTLGKNGERLRKHQFTEVNRRLADESRRALFYSSLSNPAARFVNSMVYASILFVGAFLVLRGEISLGVYAAFLAYAQQFNKPFSEIATVMSEFQNALSSSERILSLLSEEEWADPVSPLRFDSCEGSVEFRALSFAYPGQKSFIKHLNLKVRPGQQVAVVGKSGSGKSTLINLLLRFYDATEGDLQIDQKSIYCLRREELRKKMALVLQESFITHADVYENISLGRPGVSEQDCEAAALRTGADRFIRQLRGGYRHFLEGDQCSLSEGQKQLLGITRLFVSDSDMVILDEASSSLDSQSENDIRRALKLLMEKKTCFIVAHRLQTILDADLILMVDNGDIVEQGTHEELLARNGAYARLYRAQYARESL